MKIGIIGTGNMGRALGVRFAHLGHAVFFGARSKERAMEAARLASHNAESGTLDDAAHCGDALVWTVRESDITLMFNEPAVLDGKIIIDINNRDYQTEVMQGSWFGRSYAETLQLAVPKARVVKALNVVAMETLDTSPEVLAGAGAQIFIAGGDIEAKRTVGRLLEQLGFAAIDLGSDALAMRAAEALGDVIRLLIVRQGHGFRANLQLHTLPEPDLRMIGIRAASRYN
jgi:8-hydroxy-5-deazaflavin:NADPH oxidoreductase